MEIILMCIEVFQEYILDNIKNLILVGNNNITVICNKEFFNKFTGLNVKLVNSNNLSDFSYSKKSKFNKFNFTINENISKNVKKALQRGNKMKKKNKKFWYLCSLRIFLL